LPVSPLPLRDDFGFGLRIFLAIWDSSFGYDGVARRHHRSPAEAEGALAGEERFEGRHGGSHSSLAIMLIRASLANPQRVLSSALTPSGCCGRPPYLADPVDKDPKDPERVHFHGFRHPEEFDHVEASFDAFIFERLRM
jgi:hypothetical protein